MVDSVAQLENELEHSKKDLAFRIKHYEAKLATLTVINGALQSENDKLKEELLEYGGGGGGSTSTAEQELAELHEEFTRRLGAAEKAASILKDTVLSLREQLAAANENTSQAEKRVQEREAIIAQIQSEGTRLTKRAGELEGMARKARSDVAAVEGERDRLLARLQVMEAAAKTAELGRSAESDELKRSLEAAQQALAEQKEYYLQALAHKEGIHTREVEKIRSEAAAQSSAAKQRLSDQQAAYSATIEGFRESLAAAREEASRWEEKLRLEVRDLERRCRAAELAAEEASTQVSEATRPLLRQMEALQQQSVLQQQAAAQRELELERETQGLKQECASALEGRKRAEAQCAAAERRAEAADRALAEARSEVERVGARVKELEERVQGLEAEVKGAGQRAREAEEERSRAEKGASTARAAKEEAEKREKAARLELEEERRRRKLEEDEREKLLKLSSRKESEEVAGDSNGAAWSEGGSGNPRSSSRQSESGSVGVELKRSPRPSDVELERALAGGGVTANERLLAKIRQFQGEVGQLSREVVSLRAQRQREAEELVQVSQRASQLEKDARAAEKLRGELEELKKRHEMALVIIGERNERRHMPGKA